MEPIHIAIVEDDAPYAKTLAKYFEVAACGIRCTAIHPTAEDAIRNIPTNKPAVVLVDMNLPKLNGIHCIAELKCACPELLFLVLTSYDTQANIFDALKAGASGYLLKRTPPAEIAAAVHQVTQGGSPMSPGIARQVVSFFHRSPVPQQFTLTPRERQVVELLAKGAMYKEIADDLSITLETVRSHIKKIYDKLHVHSRTAAVRKYLGQEQ